MGASYVIQCPKYQDVLYRPPCHDLREEKLVFEWKASVPTQGIHQERHKWGLIAAPDISSHGMSRRCRLQRGL